MYFLIKDLVIPADGSLQIEAGATVNWATDLLGPRWINMSGVYDMLLPDGVTFAGIQAASVNVQGPIISGGISPYGAIFFNDTYSLDGTTGTLIYEGYNVGLIGYNCPAWEYDSYYEMWKPYSSNLIGVSLADSATNLSVVSGPSIIPMEPPDYGYQCLGSFMANDLFTSNLLAGNNGLSFWGASAVTSQPAAPTTLTDVINILKAYGLCAT